MNGTHPIVEIFHAKNPSVAGVNPLIDSYVGGAIQKTTDLSVIFEWTYKDANNDLQDFVIYRQLPGQPMVEYGFSKPNQMDVIYDPIVYSFAQQSSVLNIYSQWQIVSNQAILPIMNPKGAQTVHQFMDHKVPMRAINYQPKGGGNTVPVKYFISARFTDGTESPLSAPMELFFN